MSSQQQQQQQTQHKAHRPLVAYHHHHQHHPAKMAQAQPTDCVSTNGDQTSQSSSTTVQRKLFGFFYIYAILIVALYVTYAAYYFYQHSQSRQQQQQLPVIIQQAASEPPAPRQEALIEPGWKHELEARFVFVERLVSALTLELQETQRKLAEREKCDCPISCTFNGTRYADKSSWQHQCDTCTCQSGKISCQPRKCPPTTCDDPVQLAGQCCPVCMKRCKYNNTVVRHGQQFTVPDANKKCNCQDGRIKCEQSQGKLAGAIRSASSASSNTTTKPLKGSSDVQQQQQQLKLRLAGPQQTNKAVSTTTDATTNFNSKAGESQMSVG